MSAATFATAEKLVQIELTAHERAQAAHNWRNSMAALYERRTGPRRVALRRNAAAVLAVESCASGPRRPCRDRIASCAAAAIQVRCPPVTPTSHSHRCGSCRAGSSTRQLTSERLTHIYLARIASFDPQLRCVITLTEDLALRQARQADQEIAAGHYRGPLHGIPWGGKDLLDTAGIRTTYGAEPFRNRVPKEDAAVVRRLHDAGAVLSRS